MGAEPKDSRDFKKDRMMKLVTPRENGMDIIKKSSRYHFKLYILEEEVTDVQGVDFGEVRWVLLLT